MKRVIFDSSFLMAVAETPTTWYDDMVERIGKFEPVLLDCVRAELGRLASGRGRKSRAARAGVELSLKFTPLTSGEGEVDDEIVSAAITQGALVATVDGALIHTLRGAHVRVITLRSGRTAVG